MEKTEKSVSTANNNLEIAKKRLMKNSYTCVLYADGVEFHSRLRGVKPLIDFLESGEDFNGFCAADKTIGAGAAHLYVLLGVASVWANIISEDALKLLQQHRIGVFFETAVPYIINRNGDGPCPIEIAVKGIADSRKALTVIKHTLQHLA